MYSHTHKVRNKAFQAIVDSQYHCGLSCRVLTDKQADTIDRNRVALLRKCMQGDACARSSCEDEVLGNFTKYKAMSNAAVLQYWGLNTTKETLQMLRLRMYQKWAADPEWHVQVL